MTTKPDSLQILYRGAPLQTVIDNIQNQGVVSASAVGVAPTGTISATNVQAAIAELDVEKQPLLISGSTLKTINGTSLLGSGNLTISGGSGGASTAAAVSYDNSLTDIVGTNVQDALSNLAATRQVKLVSGSNVKTVNGESLIGTGDVPASIPAVASYAALRGLSTTATFVRVTDKLTGGLFYHDTADTTTGDNGGTVIINGTKRWRRLYSGPADLRWFGGVPGQASSSALSLAINTGHDLYLDAFFALDAPVFVGGVGRSVTITGSGPSSAGFTYAGTATAFTYSKDVAGSNTLTLDGLGFRCFANGATAIAVQGVIPVGAGSGPFVLGQLDSAFVRNVTITTGNGSSYWGCGLRVDTTGGIHAYNLKVEGTGAGQLNTTTKAVWLSNSDDRVFMIRALTAVDSYFVRQHIAVFCDTGNISRTMESVYLYGGEAICHSGLVCQGNVGAIYVDGLHMDVIETAVNCEINISTVARFVGCDFRKNENGGPLTAGPMFKFDSGEGVIVLGCYLSGIAGSPGAVGTDPTNWGFKFTNQLRTEGMKRVAVTGCILRGFSNVFESSANSSNITVTGNTYVGITGTIYEEGDPSRDFNKLDAVVSHSALVNLTAAAEQIVYITRPQPYAYFPSAFLTVIPTIASNYVGNLSINYSLDDSNAGVFAFRIKGNTGPQTIRISFIAYGAAAARLS